MFLRKRNLRVHNDREDEPEFELGLHEISNPNLSSPNSKDPSSENPTTGCKPVLLSHVFPEELENLNSAILDPQGPVSNLWNKLFLAASLISLFIDPLFLFSPNSVKEELCNDTDAQLDFLLTILRSVVDAFYLLNIIIQFRTAYVEPSSRVLGRGELVIDVDKISARYLAAGNFWIDVLAALPIPQVIIWAVVPAVHDSLNKASVRYFIILQYLLRLSLIFPLCSKISKATGDLPKTAWSGVTCNITLFYLMSHVAGACWYLLALQRQEECWRMQCGKESRCKFSFFDCQYIDDPARSPLLGTSNVTNMCDPNNDIFHYGIYRIALQVGAPSAPFVRKFFYAFWWGLQSLSSVGNNLGTSSSVMENIFTNIVAVTGLILIAFLIGNVQRYLQSTSLRLEEHKSRRADTERWMDHRQLPLELKRWVRKYDQHKWVATRGVDADALLKDMPTNLRRKINRHLYFRLLRQVPIFDEMDEHMLDGICDKLKTVLCVKGTFIYREGEPVNRMLFIIRGKLNLHTTNGGRAGFFSTSRLEPGSFCGEELLTWALDPEAIPTTLPSSTHTVKALTEVEAFCLRPDDLMYVAATYRKLGSRKVVQNFRFHSHQWRLWAACFIQAAWRRYKRNRELYTGGTISSSNGFMVEEVEEELEVSVPRPDSGLADYAARVMRSIRRGSSNRFGPDATFTC